MSGQQSHLDVVRQEVEMGLAQGVAVRAGFMVKAESLSTDLRPGDRVTVTEPGLEWTGRTGTLAGFTPKGWALVYFNTHDFCLTHPEMLEGAGGAA